MLQSIVRSFKGQFSARSRMDGSGKDYRSSLATRKQAVFENVDEGPGHERYASEEDLICKYSSPHRSPSSGTPSLVHKDYRKLKSSRKDELRQFRTSLQWWGLDQSTRFNIVFSWFVFVMFSLIIPFLSSFLVACPPCEAEHAYGFDKLVQIPESSLAAIAFFSLSRYVQRYGLRRFLLLDQLCDDTPKVQQDYMKELDSSLKLLARILLPSFLVELVHKILWFTSVTVSIPYIHGRILSNSIMFAAVLMSWLYRTGIYLLLCVLFRLTCHLQIFRLDGFRKYLADNDPGVTIILKEHMRIRHQLLLTSHRFRMFIVASLLTITICQFMALLMTLSSVSTINFFNAGDLVVCSAVQLTGFLLCLLGAAKITHRAQGIVSVASRWHSLSTCTSHGAYYSQRRDLPESLGHDQTSVNPFGASESASDSESSEVFFMFPSKDAVAAFQIRQSFITYLQYNSGGITLFGFVLDRGLLHTLFAFEFSLVMWILSKAMVLT